MFINEDFSKDTIEKRKGLFERSKESLGEGKFAKGVYNRLIIRDRSPRLENAEEEDSNVWDVKVKERKLLIWSKGAK